jgi:hypothetical protein
MYRSIFQPTQRRQHDPHFYFYLCWKLHGNRGSKESIDAIFAIINAVKAGRRRSAVCLKSTNAPMEGKARHA